MSDATITAEEREMWASTAAARINAVTPERQCEITAQERLVKSLKALEQAEACAEKAEADKAALEEDLEATEKNLKESSGFIEELLSGLKHRFPVQYADLEGDEYGDDAFSSHDLFEFVIDPVVIRAEQAEKELAGADAEISELRDELEDSRGTEKDAPNVLCAIARLVGVYEHSQEIGDDMGEMTLDVVRDLLAEKQTAEAENARLTKMVDWLANQLDCPPEFTNCAVDCAECRIEAARRAVAAGEE